MTRRACRTAVLALAMLPGLALWRPAEAKADPAAILAHLQATPASQLDLSLARLGTMVDNAGAGTGAGPGLSFASFADVEEKDIVIRAYSETAKPDKASCRKIMDRIKQTGGVDAKTGEPQNPASAFASLFSYPGVDEFKIDQSYAETVDSMIAIMVVIGQTGDGKGMVCQSRLLSPDVTYQME